MNVTSIRREDLGAERVEALYALMTRHFSGVEPNAFARDLQEKSQVLIVEDEVGAIRGFTTLLFSDATVEGRAVRVVCSGDTVVDSSARWSTALARGWLDAATRAKASQPGTPLYWLLICSGYRTYRYLPVFFREFWPRNDRPTPPLVERIMRRLARDRWGSCYRSSDGIVRFPHPQVLRSDAAWPAEGRRRNPHVAYFLRRNPGHFRGDELVCLAEVDDANLSRASTWVLRRAERHAPLDGVTG